MKIYRPTNSNIKTQGFGQNKPCARVDKWGRPDRPFKIVGTLSRLCPQGYKKFYPLINLKGHNGEDWATWDGEHLYFPVEADVEWTAKNEIDMDGGKGLDMISDKPIIDGKRIKLRFWHLKDSAIPDGHKVKLGDHIGWCDSTGASSGHHLHWSMKFVDENGETMDRWNGYLGAVDFSEYYENIFVLDIIKKQAIPLTAQQKAKKLRFLLKNLNVLFSRLRVLFDKLRLAKLRKKTL